MKRYFVTDIHKAPDAGAMERDLVNFAKGSFLNVLISESGIQVVAALITEQQKRLAAEHPRRQQVLVEWDENPVLYGHIWVRIGTSQMNLTLVRSEIS